MWYESLLERNLIPDFAVRSSIRSLNRARIAEEKMKARLPALVDELKRSPIALNTADANAQHYEVPAAFYLAVLGPRLKYSSCLYENGARSLAAAEIAMLELTCQRAGIANGQQILDLGCGWGSFSLYAAEKFPAAKITGVSNSKSQKEFIDAQARARGLDNLTIVTCDINDLQNPGKFDRIVSVEMFEHVRNYERLLSRIASWLAPEGKLFVHIFCHREFAYPFEVNGDNDWMAKYFFTGGLMPSADLLNRFNRDLRIVEQWAVNGVNYEKTCNEWLANMDANRSAIMPLFEKTYGREQALKFWSYWRIFFMACAELFGHNNGNEWFVSHYLFERAAK